MLQVFIYSHFLVFYYTTKRYLIYKKDSISSSKLTCRLYFRVFSDRLVDDKDREGFVALISEKLGTLFDQTYHNICPNKVPPLFGDYLNTDQTYEDITDMGKLKKQMQEMLEDYNR